MDDQGFDFRRAPERRERKPFEPPPWERDAFEQLERRREPEASAEQSVTERAEQAAGEPAGSDVRTAGTGSDAKKNLSEAEVLELLAGLAAEEPDAHAPATQVTVGASIVLLPIGVMMMFWGMAALARAASAQAGAGIARTGAVTLLVFGAGFIAAAFWLIYRLMKQRGVL